MVFSFCFLLVVAVLHQFAPSRSQLQIRL
uniref:Uncharacterized protein n=1 Tax=Rhizophora mucronata TaxID=61149 RepID=A0A2P2QIM6_RHIMU